MNEFFKEKIKIIQPIEISIPYDPPFVSAWAPNVKNTRRGYTLIKLTTENGIIGWGVCGSELAAQVNKAANVLQSKNLFETEQHARVLRSYSSYALWGIEIAIWDAIGKILSMPLYKLWGGCKDKITAYASTVQTAEVSKRVEDAVSFSNLGFRAIKLRAHYENMRDDIELVEKVKNAVGDKMEIMVDANQALDRIGEKPNTRWDKRRAKKTAQEYDKMGVVWLEDPLPKEDIDGLRKLKDEVDIPISGGETISGLYELTRLVKWDVYDILHPDPLNSEGISQLHKIAQYCELAGKWFIPHHGRGAIGFAANLHLCCAIPNSPYIEYIYDPPYRTVENYIGMGGIVANPFEIDKEGCVSVPQTAGLGLTIDETMIEKYKTN